jgi:hypothetical protein
MRRYVCNDVTSIYSRATRRAVISAFIKRRPDPDYRSKRLRASLRGAKRTTRTFDCHPTSRILQVNGAICECAGDANEAAAKGSDA